MREQLTRFLSQVEHNRAGFEHDKIIVIAIHDHRDAAVGIHRKELRPLLLLLAQVDVVHGVVQADFFQHDGDFAAVGRW